MKNRFNERLRSITWEDYGISEERRRELKYFCLQYREKKKAILAPGDYGLRAVSFDGIGSSAIGGTSNPTEALAIRNYLRSEKARRDCNLIEASAIWAANAGGYPRAWRAILVSVTEGLGYEDILGRYVVPYGKTDFYAVRRAFYHRLDELQKIEETRENKGSEDS